MRVRLGAIAALALVAVACANESAGRKSGPAAREDELSEEAGMEVTDGGVDTAATWTDLYRDLFGPTAPASCAATDSCHGAAEHSGARGSNGYVCATQAGCRASLLSVDTGLVQQRDVAAPDKSALISALRRRSASGAVVGSMPKRSSYVFTPESIARLEAWIRAGAPDN